MSEGIAVFLGSLFLTFASFVAVDHHVVLVGDAINPNGPEGKRLKLHKASPEHFIAATVPNTTKSVTQNRLGLALICRDHHHSLPRAFSCRRVGRTNVD